MDISNFYKTSQELSVEEKLNILENIKRLDTTFSYPLKGSYSGKKRRFNHSWFANYPWLVYSKELDGAFCLTCVLFGHRIGQNSSKLDKLMSSPITNWSSANQKFKSHEANCEINKTALVTMQHFLNVMNNKMKPIDQINNSR